MYIPYCVFPFVCGRTFGCFSHPAIMNNAIMNVVYTCLLETLLSILLDIYTEVELLGHMAVLFFLLLFIYLFQLQLTFNINLY